MFKPLSTAYSTEISGFMKRSQGLTSTRKRDFYPLFYRAWQASFKEKTIKNAFKVTSLSPFNPQAILRKFNTKKAISGSTSDSDSSALIASYWKKVRRLIYQAVDDRDSRKASKLHKTLYTVSVQNSVLKHEIVVLRASLINERRRRKRARRCL
jgi:hypothetical protein